MLLFAPAARDEHGRGQPDAEAHATRPNNKRPEPEHRRGALFMNVWFALRGFPRCSELYIFRKLTAWALAQQKAHLLALAKRLVPIAIDLAVVHKDVAAVFTAYEPPTLGIVEPLHHPKFDTRLLLQRHAESPPQLRGVIPPIENTKSIPEDFPPIRSCTSDGIRDASFVKRHPLNSVAAFPKPVLFGTKHRKNLVSDVGGRTECQGITRFIAQAPSARS